MDIIEKLLNHDLTSLCFYIFSHLDSKSFANCRSVCQLWKKYIDYQFYKANVGKKCLQDKLKNNFLNDCYQPKVKKNYLSFSIPWRHNQRLPMYFFYFSDIHHYTSRRSHPITSWCQKCLHFNKIRMALQLQRPYFGLTLDF